jgi:multisubunit Na+/H+ antiporter MnhG subunit
MLIHVLFLFFLIIVFAPHALHLIARGSYMFIYARSREPKHEEPTEQAQAEEFTNLDLDQGRPWCI